jgi:hypothetical protein
MLAISISSGIKSPIGQYCMFMVLSISYRSCEPQRDVLASMSKTCMLDDLRVAHEAGSAEVGGTTVITESPNPQIVRPDKYSRECGRCAACGVSAELRHPKGTWANFTWTGGEAGTGEAAMEDRRRVQRQCVRSQVE